jgi:hypothetical protein
MSVSHSQHLLTHADPTAITDRTVPNRFKVYASTDESSHGRKRLSRQFTIDIGAGSPDAPGSIGPAGEISQTTSDDEELTFEALANDLGMVLMEDPEDEAPQPACDGSCRQRLAAFKDSSSTFAKVVRLVCRASTFIGFDVPL